MAHGIKPAICKWIECMLKGRIVQSDLLGDELWATTTKGCPQGGVLSPILWCLLVDSLIIELNKGSYFTVGYADVLVILSLSEHSIGAHTGSLKNSGGVVQ